MGGPAVVDGQRIPATDNFLQCSFVIDGRTWISCEQYFQACKFPDTSDAFAKIVKERDGLAQWTIGRNARGVRTDWDEVRVDVMYRANYEKFFQCPSLLAELLATGTGAFSLHATSDFWAVWNAKILTVVREQLRRYA